jgi:HD superfamily phosphohydrolase
MADMPAMQRLRYVSQLAGAEKVYPGATHTRFLHSLGVMHIAGLYAEHLGLDAKTTRTLRVSGLLHDIGHGPYSHQFDEIVFARSGIEGGHDTQREIILNQIVPQQMLEVYQSRMKDNWKIEVKKDLYISGYLSDFTEEPDEERLMSMFREICSEVNRLFQGETQGTPYFNIVQGPLGADRMDFVLRDAYYCGTSQYGTVDLQRIIRNSSIVNVKGAERLSYDEKVIDNIYAVLFGRFMMYKNVYFHKTARAADLMLQKILELLYEPMRLDSYVKSPGEFVKLSEPLFLQQFRVLYERRESLGEKHKAALEEANRIIDDYNARKLWKMIREVSFSIAGLDPGSIANSVGIDTISRLKNVIQRFLSGNHEIPEEERQRLAFMVSHTQEVFRIDTPYKLSLAHPAEFSTNQVYITVNAVGGSKYIDFEEYLKENPFYQSLSAALLQIVRVYVESADRDILQKYGLIPKKEQLNLTTRW